jgi:hypothetical protein
MTRSQFAALAAAVALGTVACSAGTDAEPPREPASTSAGTPSESATTPAADPLEARPAEKMLSIDGTVAGADDGTAVVLSTDLYARRTTYRLYDRRWRPLTPVLEVRGQLVIDRGLADTFLGSLLANRTKEHPRVDERVMLSSEGILTTVDDRSGRSSPPVTPRPGDRRLDSVGSGRLVHRADSGTVHRTTVPEWDDRHRSWNVTAAGHVCALESSTQIGATIHASIDEGRTFTDLSTAVLPASSGPRVQSCETAGDRVAVMTGGEYPRQLHVLDRATGTLLVSHDLDVRRGPYDPYGWRLLPDGKLVIDTRGPGLYVATDDGNEDLEYRPAPRLPSGSTFVVGDDLVLLSAGRRMYYSSDEGRTWTEVDM